MHLKTLGGTHKIYVRWLWKEREKNRTTVDLGTQGTTQRWVLWVSFLPHIPRLDTGETDNPDRPSGTDKNPKKSLLFLAKGPENGKLPREKPFRQCYSTLIKHHRKKNKLRSHPRWYEERLNVEPRFPNPWAYNKVLTSLPGWRQRRPSRELELSPPLANNKSPGHRISGDHAASQDFQGHQETEFPPPPLFWVSEKAEWSQGFHHSLVVTWPTSLWCR